MPGVYSLTYNSVSCIHNTCKCMKIINYIIVVHIVDQNIT